MWLLSLHLCIQSSPCIQSSLQYEKPLQEEALALQLERKAPVSATRESPGAATKSPCVAKKTQHSHKIKKSMKLSQKESTCNAQELPPVKSLKCTTYTLRAFQVVLVVKNLPASAGDIRDAGSIPRLGRAPGGGHGNPLQYCCLENPHGQSSLVGYSPWGHKE